MNDRAPDLGELEREVMQLVWSAGETTADAIRERLARKPKESTVRTVLRRLEEKGYVTHTVDGRTYVFRAAEARPQVAARAVSQHRVEGSLDGANEGVLVGIFRIVVMDQHRGIDLEHNDTALLREPAWAFRQALPFPRWSRWS